MKYLYPNQVLFLHKKIMEQMGSEGGVRDLGLLESAVYRPQSSFGGQDLYPDLFLKAAALIHSIVRNHPFVDGNKRTGFEAMSLFLYVNGREIKASVEESYRFVIRIAQDRSFSEENTAEWLKTHSEIV